MTQKKTSNKGQPAAGQRPRRFLKLFLVVLVGQAALFILIELFQPSLLEGVWPFNRGKTDPAAAHRIDNPKAPLLPFYAPEVLHWRSSITRWAAEYRVNPNVLAIVIQIESCGNPSVISWAGAVGLMQVMPFHFADGENMLDPDTNVRRGMTVFYECLSQFAGWDLGLALACYNGGPSVTVNGFNSWPYETQAYYRWATGMWDDVVNDRTESKTLAEWRASGGETLCAMAASSLYPAASQTNP